MFIIAMYLLICAQTPKPSFICEVSQQSGCYSYSKSPKDSMLSLWKNTDFQKQGIDAEA